MSEDILTQMAADAEAMNEETDTSTLEELGLRAWELDRKITSIENDLKAAKKELAGLLERDIPEAMTEASLPEFGITTPAGTVARLSNGTKLLGSLRYAPDQDAAVAYLEATGFGGGVKTVLSVDFTEEDREQADEMAKLISASGAQHEAHLARELNAQTLMAFARSKLKDDPTWDYERVGLTAFPMAKFTKR